MDPLENLTTVATDDDLRKTMIAAEGSLFAALPGMNAAPPDHLLLNLHEYISWNNGIVIVLNIVLWYIAVVLDPLLLQKVFRVGLLQKCVSDVFFIPQDLFDVARVPFFVAGTVQDAIGHQSTSDLQFAGTFQVFPVDAFDDFSFFRDDDQIVVLPAV